MANITDNLTTLARLSPLDAVTIEELPTYYISGFSIAAATTALAWDTLLTLEEERAYIWKSSWQSIKYLYLAVRYLSITVQGVSAIFEFSGASRSDKVCLIHKFLAGIGIAIMMGLADILLIYRVFAFCGRNKRLLYSLIFLYICTHTTTCTLLFVFAGAYQEVANPLAQLHPLLVNCLVVSLPRTLIFVWPIMLIFQSILFSCVILRVIYTRYGAWTQGIPLSPLYMVFVRDGLWAYSAIVVNLILCVIYIAKHSAFGPALILWMVTTSSVCSCRLILNLRGIYHRPSSGTLTESVAMQTKEMLSIRFHQASDQETTI